MKKILTLTALLSSLSMADIIGGEINLGYYTHTPSGTASYKHDNINMEDTLGWDQESDIFLKAYIEHPLPLIPNIKLGYTNLSHTGTNNLEEGFQWGGSTYTTNEEIESNFDLTMYDLTLYYELLDNWLNADVGLNIKYLDGSINIKSNTKSETTDFTLPIPMLYAKARFDVPTTDLSFQVEGNYITYDGDTLYDIEVGARYTFLLGLGIEAGYKTLNLTIDDIDDTSLDADFTGVYGKLVWDF